MNPWELIIQQPLINVLIAVAHAFGDNFGLAIIALTIFVNLCMLPLTLSQLRSSRAMQALQPKLAELQKKYGKDRQKLAQEQMRLYKESGVKPAGCAITMIIQMPVWIALYQSILLVLARAPEGLLNLSHYLYPWDMLYAILPLNQHFLGMNLADSNFILAILVGVTMWLQQKMATTTAPTDPKQAQQSQMMLWLMPMMFTLLALSFASGLALYWVVNSIIRIILQYRVTGWGGLRRRPATDTGTTPTGKSKTYVDFKAPMGEKRTADDAGADIVISDEKGYLTPDKKRYLPGRDRNMRKRKK